MIKKSKTFYTKNLNITVGFNDEYGKRILILSTLYKPINLDFSKDFIKVEFFIEKCPFNAASYSLAVFVADDLTVMDWIDNATNIEVESGDFYGTGKVNSKNLGQFLIDYNVNQIY